jgi:insulysin
LVEKALEIISLRPVDKEELVDLRCVALSPKVTHLLEIPLADAENENSCVFSYFEAGVEGKDLRKKLIHRVVMQYLDEPTFNQLRTIEQLGYVVFARNCTYRDIMGT